jgi:hypothetical protein
LHVLGTPPAFILSQDQTLRKKNMSSLRMFVSLFLLHSKEVFTGLSVSSYHSSVVKVPVLHSWPPGSGDKKPMPEQ